MKIKICGLTDAQNAKQIALLGIDAIGLVFYKKSPRFVNINTAIDIVNALPPFVNRVGLFVNADYNFVDKVLSSVAIDTLQFHGHESINECLQYGLPFIKAIHITKETNIKSIADEYSKAKGLLLDTFNKDLYGGTGKTFDWSLAKADSNLPIILAGGISSENVKQATKIVNPYAIDVSSSVEIKKGIKDIEKTKKLLLNCGKLNI
jgi:phosphoribosylanthranilate isomerase